MADTRENEIRDVLTRATGTGWEAAYRGDVAYLLDRVEALEAALAGKGESAPEPVRRGCWACSRNYYDEDGSACCNGPSGAIYRWLESVTLDSDGMPPRDADGCPGWAAKS